MFNPGKVLIGFAVCLGATSTAFAGLMPASGLFAGQQCPAVFCEKDSHAQGNPAQICYPSSTDLALYPGALFPEADANHRQTSETQPLLRLTNATTSSFDLCLYALIGLGICRTGPWIKTLLWLCAGVVSRWRATSDWPQPCCHAENTLFCIGLLLCAAGWPPGR